MLIDLSCRPPKIVVDECVKSIVVRTLASPDADGLIRRYENRRGKRVEHEVPPVVRLPRGDVTCMETRLPLHHIHPRTPRRVSRFNNEDKALPILPDPFEVVSFYKDAISDKPGIWRANLIVELHENRRIWFITIQDETNSIPLVILSSKDLETSPQYGETTPLQRFIRTEGRPVSVWDRVMEDDE